MPAIKRGTARKDGFIFDKYRRNPDGSIQCKVWLSPAVFERTRLANNQRSVARLKDPVTSKRLSAQSGACSKKQHVRDYRHMMLRSAKQRHKKNGIPCDLTSIEDIPFAKECPVFRIPFRIGKGNFDSPTLDRLKPALGYVKGNVIVVSRLANTIKTNATPDQIMLVAKFYKKLFKKQKL